jgi:myo-inositol 2-dehydrogenase / D-chiro-inositol 1-dehydrogenase
MTVHDFDMARWLLGSDVRGVCAKADVLIDPLFDKIDWDTAVVTLTFEHGLGTIANGRKVVHGYDQKRVVVFGSEGMIVISKL